MEFSFACLLGNKANSCYIRKPLNVTRKKHSRSSQNSIVDIVKCIKRVIKGSKQI